MYVKENNRLTDVLVASVVISSLALRNYTYLLYVLQFLMFVLCGKQLLGRVHKAYFFTSVFLVLWAAASCLWAKDESVILHRLIALAQVNVICIFFSGYVTSKEAIENMITFFVLAGVVLIVNLFFSMSMADWEKALLSYGRLGSTLDMNPNEFAGIMEITLLCAWHRLYTTKRKRYMVACAVLGVALLLTKTRASIMFVALGIGVYYVLSSPNGFVWFKRIMIGVALGIVGVIAILKIPALYNLIGNRMQIMIGGLISQNVDESTFARLHMILVGLDIFLKHMFIGVGLNNYSVEAYKNYDIWAQVYAHNTYVELLSCLGLVGFLLYYGIRVAPMFRLMKHPTRSRRKTSPDEAALMVFFKSMLIVFLVEDIAKVTYFSEHYQFFYLLIIAGTSVLMGKRTTHNHEYEAE